MVSVVRASAAGHCWAGGPVCKCPTKDCHLALWAAHWNSCHVAVKCTPVAQGGLCDFLRWLVAVLAGQHQLATTHIPLQAAWTWRCDTQQHTLHLCCCNSNIISMSEKIQATYSHSRSVAVSHTLSNLFVLDTNETIAETTLIRLR